MFATYGPYYLKTHDDDGFQGLFAQIDNANGKLGDAIGVYIVIGTSENGQHFPLYVGQTYNGFWHRLKRHYKMGKFADKLQEHGPLGFFLLPRATTKDKFLRSTAKVRANRGMKSIDWLELQLIDRCLDLNPELMNVSESAFTQRLYVPGFRDKGEKRKADAKALGNLLHT